MIKKFSILAGIGGFLVFFTLFLSSIIAATLVSAKEIAKEDFSPEEILVKFKPGTPDSAKEKTHKELGTTVKDKIEKIGVEVVKVPPGRVVEFANKFKKKDSVEYAEPNYILRVALIPNDPGFPQLWGLHNTGQTGGAVDADIDAPEAWDIVRSSTHVVGVIDTGIDYTHEDLAANMWTNPGEIPGNGIDDDSNGFIDDVNGWDFVNNDNDPFDDYGHGTHVAGTIAAVGNNNTGVAGINWLGKIAALKFLDANGYGTTDNAIKAILYANQMGFAVSNNSWGGGGFSQALYDAISAANATGYLFVAAAGNSGVNADISPMYPAAYDLPNIISVAATDHNDLKASFSNYGATSVDLGAPGVNIYSTVPKGSCYLCSASGYLSLRGTSMASPHVAGTAALLWNYNPALNYLEVKNKLLNLSDPIDDLRGKTLSGGRLNIYNLIDNDAAPPAAVTDLAVTAVTHNTAALSWTAVGDDGLAGQASRYDLRYSTAPIDNLNFISATETVGEPKPSPSGTQESFTVQGLEPVTVYYFALKVYDNVGNGSGLSNVVFRKTSEILDTVTINKADYNRVKNQLKIEATSSQGGKAVLTAVNFGTMSYSARKNVYKLTVDNVFQNPGTVTVISSLGGTSTKTVTQKGQKGK